MMLCNHDRINNLLEEHDQSMDFNSTDYEIFIDIVSESTLQVTSHNLLLAEMWGYFQIRISKMDILSNRGI